MAQPKITNDQLIIGQDGWNDVFGALYGAKTTNATDPIWSVLQNGIYAYEFSASAMNELWVSFHMGHDYKPNTLIYPHVHWACSGANTGVVRWGFEYTIAKGYNQQSFPSSTTIYIEQAATGVALRHLIAEGPTIPATDVEPDAVIMARIFRDAAHVNDTNTNTTFGLFCDLHYQVSGVSTPNKNYPFS